MFTRILIPLDGSPIAERALLWARYLAGKLDLPLRLLRVVPAGVSVTTQQLYLQNVYAEMRAQAREYLGRMETTIKDAGLSVSGSVLEGIPAERIIQEGNQHPGTLLVIATHGRSGIQRWVLGSTAEKVVRSGTLPTLVVPPAGEGRDFLPQNIQGLLVPLDGSAAAETALPPALALSRALGLPVTLLRAVQPPEKWFEELRSFTSVLPGLRAEAERYLAGIEEGLAPDVTPGIIGEVVDDTPVAAIMRHAEFPGPRLVVMTTRGRSGLGRWVLGSVTDRVVHLGRVPVLMAPP